MYEYFTVVIFTILAAGIQGLNGNPGVNSQQEIINLTDKDLPSFDILNVIIERNAKNDEHRRQVVVNINDKSLIVNIYDDGVSVSLNSLRPTSNGAHWTPSTSLGSKILEVKDKEYPYFDIMNITINKIDGARSEKIIKIFANDKIIGMDTRGEEIDFYVKERKDENTNNSIHQYVLGDSDGSRNSVQLEVRGSHTVYTDTDQSNKENKGNNSDVKGANGFIVLCFILWHLIPWITKS